MLQHDAPTCCYSMRVQVKCKWAAPAEGDAGAYEKGGVPYSAQTRMASMRRDCPSQPVAYPSGVTPSQPRSWTCTW